MGRGNHRFANAESVCETRGNAVAVMVSKWVTRVTSVTPLSEKRW